MPGQAGFRWVSAEAGRRHQGGRWWHRGENPPEPGLQPGFQCGRRRPEVIRGAWGKYDLRQPPSSKQGRIWSLWTGCDQTLEVEPEDSSFPVYLRCRQRCFKVFSQACKKNNEPVFNVKFICEEESNADCLSEHPPAPFPTRLPTEGACEQRVKALPA